MAPGRSSPRPARAAALACAVLVAAAAVPAAAIAQASVSAPAMATAPRALLTLEHALARAAERSPALALVGSGRELAAARLRGARAWGNPTLEIEAENVLGRGAYADFDGAETTMFLRQPLPLAGGRRAAVRGARTGIELAAIDGELTAREVRRDVSIAYAEAIAADRIADIERDRARIGAETRGAVERRFASGLESELQRARAEVETSGLQAAARRAAAQSLARRRALAALWRDETVGEALDESWFDAPPAPVHDLGADAEHPRLARARLEVQRSQAALDAARGARLGAIQASVGARRLGDEPPGNDRAWVLGLSMPLPLWQRNEAGIAEARGSLTAAELDSERARRELAGEREVARAEFEAAALEAGALAQDGLPAAQTAARLAAQGYEAGRLSLLERLAAERGLSETRERLVRARLALRLAEARLESLR